MSDRPLTLYVTDIIEAFGRIEKYTKGMTFADFKRDAKTVDAVVRNVEIIGEAAKHIPAKVRLKYVDIPWREIIGTRSKVIHEYFGVDEAILWRTVTEDLPALKNQIKRINISGRY